MAIQTRQQASGQTIGRWRIMSVTVGAVVISAALVIGWLGWQRPSAPPTTSSTHIVAEQPAPLGIALPHGADIRALPAGLRDYIHTGAQPVTGALAQHPLGIDLPQGANADELPTGLTDYLRPGHAEPISGTGSAYDGGTYGAARPAVPSPNVPVREVDLSYSGSAYAEFVEYLTGRPFPQSVRPTLPHSNPPVIGTGSAYDGGSYSTARPTGAAQPIGLGINLPASVNLRELPTGLTDYVRRSP